ncbi:MAG TPA: hypothetical protein VI454_05665 [Verrucomicrobiae bacterium]
MPSSPAADKSLRGPLLVISAVLAACALAFVVMRRPRGAGATADAGSAAISNVVGEKKATFKRVARPTAVAPSGVPAIAGPAPVVVRRAASVQMRQLVASLAQLDLKKGISPEQAADWKQRLKYLATQGPEAVAGIREYLERNQDYSYGAVPGGNNLGYSSLRTAMIDMLQQIGGPEAIDALVQTLRTTADPVEIALLARGLEQQAPEQYLPLALDAAREALAMAAKGELSRTDVAPLFELFQKYGGPDAVNDLEKASSKWHYYATMALADMRDGAGIPALIQMTRDPNAAAVGSSHVAFRLLAQLSGEYPDAQNALLEQARQNKIPASVWPEIAIALQGYRLQYLQSVLPDANTTPVGQITQTHGVSFGNQRFATTSTLTALTPAQIQQQVGLIDQLLASSASPLAQQFLQGARSNLASRLSSAGR